MHRASDRVAERAILSALEEAAAELELGNETRAIATDLYLSALPVDTRSRAVTLAACCYTAALIAGEERPQTTVAETFDVSRLAIQRRWKPLLRESGFAPPDW